MIESKKVLIIHDLVDNRMPVDFACGIQSTRAEYRGPFGNMDQL